MSRITVVGLLVIALVLIGAHGVSAEPYDDFTDPPVFRALVLEVEEVDEPQSPFGPGGGKQRVTVRVLTGERAGEEHQIDNYITGNPAYDLVVSEGDRVLVGISQEFTYIMDFVRDTSIYVMVGLFALSLVIVGGRGGVKALVVLGLTAVAVVYGLVPLVLRGWSPIVATVLMSGLVVSIGLVLITGWSTKTAAAILGTVVGVVVAGVLAWYFGNIAHLMGLHTQEAQMLYYASEMTIDVRGLLFAGMILGALGAIMDVTVSIASSVDEVYRANPGVSMVALARSGFNVGRDVLGTMSNTLILAYTGGALPLILLLSAHEVEWIKVANLDVIATEAVRALSGSIGLVLCVPITAFLAALLRHRQGMDRKNLADHPEVL